MKASAVLIYQFTSSAAGQGGRPIDKNRFFSDVLTGVGRRNSLSRFEGLPAGDLDASQKQLLLALVDEYVRNADFDAAERHLDAIRSADVNQLHFSWRGPTNDVRGPFYYRVHGPG